MNHKEKTDPKFTTEIGFYVIMLHDSCMKNKAHRTLLETQLQITHQTCVQGRKYIFSSMQYNLWHSSGKRMKYLL